MKFQTLSLALFVLLAVPTFAQENQNVEGPITPFLDEAALTIQPIFEGERFPNIVVTNKGTVLATWGNTQVRARRSEDGGKTWGEEIVIAKPGFQGGGTTVDETTGDILAFVEDTHPPAPLTVYRSRDDGKTWTPEKPTIKPPKNGDPVSMHMNEHGITLRHGKYAGRLIRPSRFYGTGNRPESIWHTHYTNAIFSDDGGKTWQTSEQFPENGTGEATIAELSDGRLYYNSRVHWQERPQNTRRREAWSKDGGLTWTDFKVIDILPDGHQHRSYGCMGGLVRLPVAGKDILIFSNIDTENATRERATVWASFDGGKTWPVKRLVFDGSSAYSSLNAGRHGTPSEGRIYLNFESEGKSKVARFNLSWILEGEATGDGVIPNLHATTVFEAGQDGYKVFRIPAIIRAANDDLLAFCEARQGGDASEIDLVLKRSSDGGKSWGPIEVVQESEDFRSLFDDPEKEITIGNPAPVVDQLDPKHSGRIWLPFNLENDRVFVTYSDDSGKTWAPRREITKDVKKEPWGWYATGPVHSIQLKHGPHRGRLVIPCDHRLSDDGEDRGPNGVHAVLSDDHGETWRIGALDETYDDGLNANETTVVELNDGTLYFNTRDQNGKAPGTRGEAWSRDGGESFESGSPDWEAFRPVEGVLDLPVVQGALLRAGKNLILFSGPDENGPTGKGRSDMRIRYSTDEAETWEDGPLIHTGPAAYSDMVRIKNGRVGILFEAGNPGQKSAYQRIEFTVIDPLTISRDRIPLVLNNDAEFRKITWMTVSDVHVGVILKRLGARIEAGVTPDQIEDYNRQFGFTDHDGDGRHSKTEYIDKGNYLTPQARRGIFNAADSDEDGYVTKAEYVLNRIITDEARTIMQAMDDDGNGVIEKEEFTESATEKLKDGELSAGTFGAFDTNDDGGLVVPEYLRVWGLWARVGRKSPGERLAGFDNPVHGGTKNPQRKSP